MGIRLGLHGRMLSPSVSNDRLTATGWILKVMESLPNINKRSSNPFHGPDNNHLVAGIIRAWTDKMPSKPRMREKRLNILPLYSSPAPPLSEPEVKVGGEE